MDMITYLKDIIDLTPFVNTPAVSGVRYNPLKIGREDFLRLFEGQVEQAAYYPEGFTVRSEKEGLGNSPLHLAGGCYFQEPSAMSAVTALKVQNGDKVLDLCAAPGSKATALATLNPDGLIVANEIHPKRAQILLSNMERMGVANALITRSDAQGLEKNFTGYFDKILLDAPCSGEGMFRKYPEILKNWNEELVEMCALRSGELLEHAAAMLRPGGRMVYSTCTFNLEENEKNILKFLSRHPEFEIVEAEIPAAAGGLLGLDKARRIFPSENGEGHFVCALQKRLDAPQANVKIRCFTGEKTLPQLALMIEGCAKIPVSFYGASRELIWQTAGQNTYLLPRDMPKPKGVQILRAGVQVAILKGKTFFPCHHLFTATPVERFVNTVVVDDVAANAFLSGEMISAEGKGYTAVIWNGLCLGFGKAVEGKLKNHFPKGLRL